MRPARLTVRRLMLVVVAAALLCFGCTSCSQLGREWVLFQGFYSRVLDDGQVVVTRYPVDSEDRAITIPRGTTCVVVADYAVDEDDARPDRSIRVRVLGGQHKDAIVDVERSSLTMSRRTR